MIKNFEWQAYLKPLPHTSAPNYQIYRPSVREWILLLFSEQLLCLLLSWFFYRSLWAVLPLQLPGLLYVAYYLQKKSKEEQHLLSLQFMNLILSVSASLQSGSSMENAFLSAESEMLQLYGQNSAICKELVRIRHGMSSNVPLEQLLADLGERSGLEDIRDFSRVFVVSRKTGGKITDVFERSAGIIAEKNQVLEEIRLHLSARRYEQNLMDLVPFLLMLYLQITSPGFFDCLYHNLIGIAVMTVGLVLYLLAVLWAELIMDIEV